MGLMKGALLVVGTAVAVSWLPALLQEKRPTVVGGFALPGWERVEHVFRERVERGALRGGSFAVYHRGQLVVHLYGGYADEQALVPWSDDTLSIFYSTTKGIGAICMALLVDRGHLDYDERVVKYWPEFGQNGKEKVTVRQLLSHQAGLAAFDEQVSMYSIKDDPERVEAIAARSKPMWTLGDGFGYHALTLGIYLNALVKRCDPKHRNISQFYDDEIRKPLGADFFIGVPRSEHYRVTRYEELSFGQFITGLAWNPEMFSTLKPFLTGDLESFLLRSFNTFKEIEDGTFQINNPLCREVQLASATGFGTAAGVAKIWGTLANGGKIDGKVLMRPTTVQKLTEPVISGLDKVTNLNNTMGVATDLRTSPEGNIQAGHPGSGGQMAYMDDQRGLGWAYVSNYADIKLVTDTYTSLTDAMYAAVKNIQ